MLEYLLIELIQTRSTEYRLIVLDVPGLSFLLLSHLFLKYIQLNIYVGKLWAECFCLWLWADWFCLWLLK